MFHQTLKNMMHIVTGYLNTYCLSNKKDWNQVIPNLLFAVMDDKQESLGFSLFKLVYGHTVCGLLKEKWLDPETETS